MSLTKFLDSTTDLYHPIRHWNQKDLSLLTGEKGQYKLALRWQVAFVQAGYKVFNLDCAVRFNPFLITAETRLQNIPPEPFLEEILIQRAFTPYQILDSLIALLQNPKPDTIYFLLAPCKQFLDGDVKDDEGLFLLHKMLHVLESFPKRQIPLLVVESWSYRHKNFQKFFPKLLGSANNLWELQTEDGLSRIKTRKIALAG
ncbi:MAG: hypothetical protein O9301_09615 [Leptospira sp.]|nr:hypothetical protein [Leptospira sp.]